MAGLPIVSADIVEVAPVYDHTEVNLMAASHVAYELLGLFGKAAGTTRA